jgi:hypothetical protein
VARVGLAQRGLGARGRSTATAASRLPHGHGVVGAKRPDDLGQAVRRKRKPLPHAREPDLPREGLRRQPNLRAELRPDRHAAEQESLEHVPQPRVGNANRARARTELGIRATDPSSGAHGLQSRITRRTCIPLAISTEEGEELQVLQEDLASGWLWCRAKDGREGWVPERTLSRFG